MSRCHDTTVHAVDAIERIASAEDLWNTAASIASNFGFEYVVALKAPGLLAGGIKSAVVFSNVAADILEALDQGGFAGLAERALSQFRPFAASELPPDSLTAQQILLVETVTRTLSIEDALFVPVRAGHELEGLVVLAGREPVMLPVVRSSLHILAHVAFGGASEADRAVSRKQTCQLSPREAECLRLAARGKTDVEIGRILSISPRTTRFHIENAKKKLGVTTRTQAVAQALRLNAIAA